MVKVQIVRAEDFVAVGVWPGFNPPNCPRDSTFSVAEIEYTPIESTTTWRVRADDGKITATLWDCEYTDGLCVSGGASNEANIHASTEAEAVTQYQKFIHACRDIASESMLVLPNTQGCGVTRVARGCFESVVISE